MKGAGTFGMTRMPGPNRASESGSPVTAGSAQRCTVGKPGLRPSTFHRLGSPRGHGVLPGELDGRLRSPPTRPRSERRGSSPGGGGRVPGQLRDEIGKTMSAGFSKMARLA